MVKLPDFLVETEQETEHAWGFLHVYIDNSFNFLSWFFQVT